MSIVTRTELPHGALPNHTTYFFQVLGKELIKDISVVSFKLAEKAGEPYRIEVVATHTTKFKREVILGHEAKFTMALHGVEPRTWGGRITHFTHTKTTNDISNYEIVVRHILAALIRTQPGRISTKPHRR